jgi:hypothetical protein
MPLDVDLILERSYFAETVAAHRSRGSCTQTEGLLIQVSAPDAPDTPTSGPVEHEISPEEVPSPAMTLDSSEHEGPSHLSIPQTWPIRKPRLVSSSHPSATALPLSGLDPDMSIAVQDASRFLDNHLTSYKHAKLIVRQEKAMRVDKDEELRSAKRDLELRRGELEVKRQQVEDMENSTGDLDSLEESDLQVRQWLDDYPPLADKSWRKLMDEIVAVANAKRANAFAEGTERISQLEDLHKSLFAIDSEVKNLEEEVTARELSLRALVIKLHASEADLERLRFQRAKAFEDTDFDLLDSEE